MLKLVWVPKCALAMHKSCVQMKCEIDQNHYYLRLPRLICQTFRVELRFGIK